MARWEPGAKDRLRIAALDLFATNGFDETTAADIARVVGLTERIFFRHFSDKREVLFDGQEFFERAFLDAIDTAPDSADRLELVTAAIAGAAAFFPDDSREFSRRRQIVISSNPGLQERELLKMSGLSATLAGALRARGIPEPGATLAAETAVTVFGVSFSVWIGADETRSMIEIERAVLRELSALTSPAAPPA